MNNDNPFKLTRREAQVVALMHDEPELTQAEVADRLLMSYTTLLSHTKAIREKTGAARTHVGVQRIGQVAGEAVP